MKRWSGLFALTTLTACFAGGVLTSTVSVAQSSGGDEQRRGSTRRQSVNISGNDAPAPARRPGDQRQPLPPTGRPPRQAPPARTDDRSAIERARGLENDTRERHGLNGRDRDDRDRDDRPRDRDPRRSRGYYDYWTYDRYRYGDDRYRGDYPERPDPGYDRAGDDGRATHLPGEQAVDRAAPPGAMLPPEDLIDDEDLPQEVRKALDASAPYREATAQLLRVWAEYARAAEQVMQRLKPTPRYQRAVAELRDAEAKLAAVRDRGGKVPAVNLVTVAQQALLARRAVRSLEEQAVDADPAARRAKEQLDQAVERREKIKDEVRATVDGAANG